VMVYISPVHRLCFYGFYRTGHDREKQNIQICQLRAMYRLKTKAAQQKGAEKKLLGSLRERKKDDFTQARSGDLQCVRLM
jgi:hypothetical protein